VKTNISQHLWSQRFESITERITSSLTVCLSNCTKHQLCSVRNLQPKHEGVLAGLTEILPKNTRMMCERCWHFRSYCFPQGISTVAALQCGLVTAGPRGLPFPLLPVAVILTICGLIWKSWPVSFHPKEDFVCKMGFHGSGIILISFKKKKYKKKYKKRGGGRWGTCTFLLLWSVISVSVSFFICNNANCFLYHFFRMKKVPWKIIGGFQLPTYKTPVNSNPAAEAINPCFCTPAKLCWNQWSRAHLTARMIIRSVAN